MRQNIALHFQPCIDEDVCYQHNLCGEGASVFDTFFDEGFQFMVCYHFHFNIIISSRCYLIFPDRLL